MHTTNTHKCTHTMFDFYQFFFFFCSGRKTSEYLKALSKHRPKANSECCGPEWSSAIAALSAACTTAATIALLCVLRFPHFLWNNSLMAEYGVNAASYFQYPKKCANSIMFYCASTFGSVTVRRMRCWMWGLLQVSVSLALSSSCPRRCKKALCCALQYKSFTGFA